MEQVRSPLALPARHRGWLAAALGAAFAYGCATGVAVTDEELAEICDDPNLSCGNETGGGGSPIGGSGTGGTGVTGGQSGSFNAGGTGGTGVTGGQSGSFNAGGSSSGTAGASSTAGTGGSGTSLPLAEGDCLATSAVTILYRDRKNGATSTNEPSMVLSVQNSGPAFDLSTLTIRYWFTADGNSGFTGNVDYAAFDGQQNLTSSVMVSFAQEFGSDYVELSFPGATGSVTTGVQEVQLRFHSNPYADLDQTNDFSFLSPATNATPNPNITPYVNGTQVGGCTPIP